METITKKHAGGRPRKLQQVAEVERQVRAYWKQLEDGEGKAKIPTITRLARALGFARVESLMECANRQDEISVAINKAITDICTYWEQRLDSPSATGAIFWLKNRGWKDIQEVKVNDEQAKAITESQREVARQLVERQLLTTSLPSVQSSVLEGIKPLTDVQSTNLRNPGDSDIGRSVMDTSFTSDNTTTTSDK